MSAASWPHLLGTKSAKGLHSHPSPDRKRLTPGVTCSFVRPRVSVLNQLAGGASAGVKGGGWLSRWGVRIQTEGTADLQTVLLCLVFIHLRTDAAEVTGFSFFFFPPFSRNIRKQCDEEPMTFEGQCDFCDAENKDGDCLI